MQMPAWFDLYGFTPDAEEDESGINMSTKMLHSMIDEEVRSGIPSHRIVIGGFSMGGSLALYAGLTYDKPLAGILGLSSFLVQKSKVPGELADVRAFLAERLPKI
uniref:palmitoyl-protein hydrolase n=1 Tax=Parascaris univalens TaxID=6257 RepID=A0A914ZWI3_PARUN